MKKLLIILLLIVGCEEVCEEITINPDFDTIAMRDDFNNYEDYCSIPWSCSSDSESNFTLCVESDEQVCSYPNGDGIWGNCIEQECKYSDQKPPICNPTKVRLDSPYPNPMNPGSSIVFDIPTDGNVKLYIINNKFEIIRTLLDTTLNKGINHSTYWDGLNSNGDYASEIYYSIVLEFGEGECYTDKCYANVHFTGICGDGGQFTLPCVSNP